MSTSVDDQMRLAEDLADLFLLVRRQPDEDVRQTVRRVVARHSSPPSPVRIAQAAVALEVSVPTVRSWVGHGVLEDVPGGTVRQVSAVSLGWTMAVLKFIEPGPSQKLAAALASLADRELLLTAHRRYEEVREADLIRYSAADLNALREEG